MLFKIFLSFMLILGMAGCASQKKNMAALEGGELKTRIAELESTLLEKDEEIRDLEEELEGAHRPNVQKPASAQIPEASDKIDHKEIQIALKNANFYDGPIDGKIGKGTKKAIREFQSANGLVPDGIVGPKTWASLKTYLEGK